ncbi:hypothetical protein SAMN02745163_04373 [Clostridium cavendishii DSM 21758]|uniref:histidine kinase n=1 Tax=Clostridium cavendishii DSM 21758 TaxID=1121302 RepID=A0A1M6UWX7_9CLOT|nr:HAMP domain-containing sensor histidine kinase [Clostridium cavendishii]SHK73663.1 hypothetical protein SAMN02745163_04373 [Clostridium cavendishii DSM 21758]
MQLFVIIVLLAIIGIVVTLYTLSLKEIRNIKNQLKKINGTKTNSKILATNSNKEIKGLIAEINKSIEEKQKSEAEHKNIDLEVRQAIANMSHDLRTPLTSIMGYIQLIEDDNIKEEERKQYLNIVKNRTKDLEGLISSFYDLSRLEGNEYKFNMASINISNVMCEVLGSFYNDFLRANINPIVEIDEKPYFIIGDEVAIKRVISNLIQNILRYGQGDVVFSLKKQEDTVITFFENTAKNLTKEDAEHLFDRFFTADRARTGKSTGLGLAITKQLVNQMGHEIKSELISDKLRITLIWKMIKEFK